MILITSGDANGVGIEVILKGLKGNEGECLVIGCEKLYRFYQKRLGLSYEMNRIRSRAGIGSFDSGKLNIYDIPYEGELRIGEVCEESGAWSLKLVDEAIDLMKCGVGRVLITGPVNKESIMKRNVGFRGHTEYLGRKFGVKNVREVS